MHESEKSNKLVSIRTFMHANFLVSSDLQWDSTSTGSCHCSSSILLNYAEKQGDVTLIASMPPFAATVKLKVNGQQLSHARY